MRVRATLMRNEPTIDRFPFIVPPEWVKSPSPTVIRPYRDYGGSPPKH